MLLARIGQPLAYQGRGLLLFTAINSLFSDTESSLSVEIASRVFLHDGGIFFLHQKEVLNARGTGKEKLLISNIHVQPKIT